MAANRPHVPKFGDWKEDAPFTVVFDKASRTKRNPNMSNPEEYPEMTTRPRTARHDDQPPNHNVRPRHERVMSYPEEYPEMNPQTRNHRQDQQPPNHNERLRHERYSSREETEFRPSPAHSDRNKCVRAPPTSESYNYQSYGRGSRSLGNPPETNRNHPQYHHVPVQPRPIRNLRGQSSERVATIPPFPGSGSSNENQSYTLIFDKVKEERNQGPRSYNGSTHTTPTRPINEHHKPLPSSSKGCCFQWNRKRSY